MRQRNQTNVLCAYCYGWTRNLTVAPFSLTVDGVETQVHLHQRCVVPAKEDGFTLGDHHYRFDEVSSRFVPADIVPSLR